MHHAIDGCINASSVNMFKNKIDKYLRRRHIEEELLDEQLLDSQ